MQTSCCWLADAELFNLLANQAGIALENTQLYAELYQRMQLIQEQQKALLQTEKMAAIGRLTASIAHEVNNPLQAVRNCLHLVTREDLDVEKRGEYLELAQQEMQRLMDTVKEMLDFYRPSNLVRELVDINAVIQTVLSLLAKQFEEVGIKVETRLAKGLPLMYLVRNQIQQVFFNVLLNAMEAMPEGGTVFVRTEGSNGSVVILIEDTGPGVPEETRQKLFEPFVSSKPRGTGLGLSVSYSIVDAHAGTIELLAEDVAGSSGQGAIFRVTLPIMEAA
jgi:two-component system NtrC family sensor kinase